jgi:hypothetical protein
MSDAEFVSHWARGFVLASAGFLVAWQALSVTGIGRRTTVLLGLHGFILHMIFGKAYSLVPSYFNRKLKVPHVMPINLILTVTGVITLAVGGRIDNPVLAASGGWLWISGVLVFVAALLWTIRGNLSGGETGTGEANADRRRVDRVANGFVPVALFYLVVGSYATVAPAIGTPPVFDGYPPRATHLVAAGTATLLVFSMGFRLLPRFLVTRPPSVLVGVTLVAGAIGPVLLAGSLSSSSFFTAGAGLEALAFLGFGSAYVVMFARSDRDRIGFYSVMGGIIAGTAGITMGLWFALHGVVVGLVDLHFRLNLLGFLGLTIIGIAYQFYPPSVGTFWGASDRTALASVAAILTGLGIEAGGNLLYAPLESGGRVLALLGALLYAGLLVGLFWERYW